ncbi:MAG: winged helix-turn-helix domain-containing protein, partial [Clostridiales bacterium]|nr:winged helix-turn-helix domain-containing protein [Clostridiales bacterium]
MLTPELDSTSPQPLYEQLYYYLRGEIEHGALAPGEKLPSKRNLASSAKLSVMTVERAYSQLTAEGYLRSEDRRGFFVEQVAAPGPSLPAAPTPKAAPPAAPAPQYPYDVATHGVGAE